MHRTDQRRATSLAISACFGLALTLAGAPPAPAGPLDEVRAAGGLRQPASSMPAIDFDLPLVGGGQGSLSDYSGRWVVLTFWATWCGPCRAEMPTLERLHRELEGEGVSVVGVTVDERAQVAADFLAEHEVTFPNFHDADGRVASAYRADSIPLSYLIDPRGSIVGYSRGARDWTRIIEPLGTVAAAMPASDGSEVELAGGGRLDLSAVSEPPSAEIELLDPAPRPGRGFDLEVRLRWAGDFEEYLPHPPLVHLPEGVVRDGVRAEASSRDGRHLVTYRVALRAQEEGRYALDPVELRYTPRHEPEPVARRLEGPTVEVRRGSSGGVALAVGAGGLALAGVAVGFGLRRRRRARRPVEAGPSESLEELYARARSHRLQGDLTSCLMALAELDERLEGNDEAESRELDAAVEAARFGGQPPPREELDKLQRRLERRLEMHRPDPRASARSKLRLRRASGGSEEDRR